MRYDNAAIPSGMAWSSPFVRWQGSLAEMSGLDVAADVTATALEQRGIDPGQLGGLVLGWTVPQPGIHHGAAAFAARIGAPGITGPMISQSCVTSVACLAAAASAVAAPADGPARADARSGAREDGGGPWLVVAADRTSNGPTLNFPAPSAPGGAPVVTNWVLDSFAGDAMLDAAGKAAADYGISREQLDELAGLRFRQYARGLGGFQRQYLVPVRTPDALVDADEGVRGLGTHLAQTHPADGAAGAIVTTIERARELAGGEGAVRILATGSAGSGPDLMYRAARAALRAADLRAGQVDAVTTHSPFAVGDLCFARRAGFPAERMNSHGCSLVYGHPGAPTGLRSIAELIAGLRLRGGGIGLFTGWAADDTAAAVVVRADD